MPFGFGAQLNGTHVRLADEGEFAACRGVLTSNGLGKPYLGPSPASGRFTSAGEGHSRPEVQRVKAIASLQAKGIPPPLDTECKGARGKCVRGRGNALRLRRSVKWGSCAVAVISRFAAYRGVLTLLPFARLYLSPSLAAITPLLQAKGISPP